MALKVFRMDASGCNGCDIEIVSATLDPRLGADVVEIVHDPSEAQAILVTGGVNAKSLEELNKAVSRLGEPRLVVAVGTCASSMCVFKDGYPMRGPLDAVAPASVAILGCPTRPQTLVSALRSALDPAWRVQPGDASGPEGMRGMIAHDAGKCTACGACVRSCPSSAIDLAFDGATARIAFNLWKCSFCGTCQEVCPDDAARLTNAAPGWESSKEKAAVTGEMALARCARCGELTHAERQVHAIRERVAGKGKISPEPLAMLDETLGICNDCKATIANSSSARRRMGEWAYG